MNTKGFFEKIFGGLEGKFLYLWTLPGKKTYWFKSEDLQGMSAEALRLSEEGQNVYYGLGAGDESKSADARLLANEVTSISSIWIDIDIKGSGHMAKNLPATIDEAMAIVNCIPLKPSIVVHSGGGIHCYWLFNEPWQLDTTEEKAKAAALVLGIHAAIRQKNPQFKIDSTQSLAQILRVAGTNNYKTKDTKKVTIISQSENRYGFDELHQHAAEPTRAQYNNAITRFERRSTDRPAETIINNCAFIEYCRDNSAELNYHQWMAMLTNITRASDGEDVAHELSSGHGGYSIPETDKKIFQVLEFMSPTTCDYIKTVLGFDGCLEGDCCVKCPSGWALDTEAGKILALRRLKIKKYGDWRDQFGTTIPGYSINNRGELCMNKEVSVDKSQVLIQVPVSNFVARITKEITKDDGLEIKKVFEIKGFLANERALHTATIEASAFNDLDWIMDVWGSNAILSPANNCKNLWRHATQLVSMKNKEIETVFCHTGWRKINGGWAYLHAGGAISADDVHVDVGEGDLGRYTLPLVVDKVKAAEMSLQLLEVANFKITIPLLALTFLTPLCEPLRQAGVEPAFVVWMQGMTQSLKSSLAAVYLSHFGDFTELSLPASFRGTAVSLERKGNLLKDSLLVVDDFHPSVTKAESQLMHKTAQSILRAWGDRRGRSRGNIDGTLRKTYAPKGTCLVTGEDLPDVGQSGVARYLAITLNRGDIDRAKLSVVQNNTDLLAQNMAGYIEWLAPNIDNIAKIAGREIKEIRDDLLGDGYHGRMPGVVASLFYGLRCALGYFFKIGAIDQSRHNVLLETGLKVLKEVAASHAETIKEEQPALKFLNAMREMLASGMVTTIDLKADYAIHSERVIGWRDVTGFYLLPSVVFAQLTKFFDTQNSKFPIGKTSLWQHLANDGYITGGSERFTIVKKIRGQSHRVIHFKPGIFDVAEENDDEMLADD